MRTFVIILVLAAFASAQKPKYGGCAKEIGADETLIKRIKDKDFDFKDDKVNKFFLCMYHKMGVLTDDGAFHKDVALSNTSEDNRERVSQAIDTCISNVGSTAEETSWNYAKCFNEQFPECDYIQE